MIAINQLVGIKSGLLRSREEQNPERLISTQWLVNTDSTWSAFSAYEWV